MAAHVAVVLLDGERGARGDAVMDWHPGCVVVLVSSEWWSKRTGPSGSGPAIRKTALEHYVGVDVLLELSSLWVLDVTGKVIRKAKVASEPEALVAFLRGLDLVIGCVGLKVGPLSQWLYDGLHEAGLGPVLLETRHVKAALSAMAVKTDRRDA